jgi:hypothetical protein
VRTVSTLLETACTQCGRANDESAFVCGLCGTVLRREKSARAALDATPLRATAPTRTFAEHADAQPSKAEPWIYLAIGLATAPVFAWTPILQYMGWFLASLVHEMGHAALAWLCGMPAIPAISLAGHAAAVHQEQSFVLAIAIACAFAAAAWHFLHGRTRIVAIALVAVLYPTIAFTGVKELLFLFAGHGGELVFATLSLWKVLDGGFTKTALERALYGTVGWYLLGKNVFLCFGLMTSAMSRAHYEQSGSFGLTNDYIRAAEDVLGWRLESVALLMLVASMMVLPAAFGLWRISTAARRSAE